MTALPEGEPRALRADMVNSNFPYSPTAQQCFNSTKRQRQTRTFGAASACQKSLAEFAARRRQRDSDHFLSGRTPGWSLLPLRGNSPPVPDRKYNSGCKSSAAALCRAQPPKAALGAELCVLSAVGGQGVRAADCNPFVKKGQSPFLTVSSSPCTGELFCALDNREYNQKYTNMQARFCTLLHPPTGLAGDAGVWYTGSCKNRPGNSAGVFPWKEREV